MARKIARNENTPRYTANVDSFIDGVLVRGGSGEEVEYFGLPGRNLDPANAAAEAVVKDVEAIEKAHHQGKLDKDQRRAALASLSDELNEVNPNQRRTNSDYDEPLSDAERKVLEKHAKQTATDTQKAQMQDGNVTGVKLQGDNVKTPQNQQGATPVTDGKK